MRRSELIGLDFQEFLAAIVKIAQVVHDGTYKSRDKSWEEQEDQSVIETGYDSIDRKLCCLFFHMFNTLNDKHNELQKGKYTKPFQIDEYARTTARSFMKKFLNDYNKGMYACLFGGSNVSARSKSSSSSSRREEKFPAEFEYSPPEVIVRMKKNRRKSHIRKQIDVDDLHMMI